MNLVDFKKQMTTSMPDLAYLEKVYDALKFYANEENWSMKCVVDMNEEEAKLYEPAKFVSRALLDGGARAEATLK